MPLKDSSLSPSDRFLAHRRKIFLRDWILVLVALGLAIAAGAFYRDGIKPHETPVATSAMSGRATAE
jgi:hypothetical protein